MLVCSRTRGTLRLRRVHNGFVSRFLGLGLLAVLSTACALFTGGLQCGWDGYEEAIYDFGSDAVGHGTIEEAIEGFRSEDDIWKMREDWHELTQGDTSSSPVEFTDERGRVKLSVDVVEHNNTWIVKGYRSCPPPD